MSVLLSSWVDVGSSGFVGDAGFGDGPLLGPVVADGVVAGGRVGEWGQSTSADKFVVPTYWHDYSTGSCRWRSAPAAV